MYREKEKDIFTNSWRQSHALSSPFGAIAWTSRWVGRCGGAQPAIGFLILHTWCTDLYNVLRCKLYRVQRQRILIFLRTIELKRNSADQSPRTHVLPWSLPPVPYPIMCQIHSHWPVPAATHQGGGSKNTVLLTL